MKKLLTSLAAVGLLAAGTASCVLVVHDDEESREICVTCGEWYGSDECCDDAAKRCKDCGMIAGSPGCCE